MTDTNNIQTIKTEYEKAINATLASHTQVKLQSQLAYAKAIEHGKQTGDWFCFSDFINKLLNNNIAKGRHLFNIMKATNNNFTYNLTTKSIKQKEGFDKNATVILSDIWADNLTEVEKQTKAFTDESFKKSLLVLLKKAYKNGFTDDKINDLFNKQKQKAVVLATD